MNIEKIKELYPNDSGYGYSFCAYGPIINAIGKVVVEVSDGDYQGDTRVLYDRGDGTVGYLNFGWGSCSGCDAMQACSTYEDVLELANSLESSTRWESRADMLTFFQTHDWGGDYSWHAEEQKVFITKVIEYLSAECEAPAYETCYRGRVFCPTCGTEETTRPELSWPVHCGLSMEKGPSTVQKQVMADWGNGRPA